MNKENALSFTTAELVSLARVTPRQAQTWDETAFIRPTSKVEHRRRYSFHEAVAVSVVGKLRKRGMSLQEVRRIMPPFLPPAFRFRSGSYLLTDGHTQALLLDSKAAVVAAMLKFTRGAYLIVIDDHIQPFLSYKRKPEE